MTRFGRDALRAIQERPAALLRLRALGSPRICLSRMGTSLALLIGLLLSISAFSGCGGKASPSRDAAPDSWTYPIRLGDSRGEAHSVLGNPARVTKVLEEYPMSGVTLWFDPEGRVSKVGMHGEAGALYAEPSRFGDSWIPSERPLVFGLTPRANEVDFVRALGTPASQTEWGASRRRETRRVWRRDGYIVDAEFLATDRSAEGKTFSKGSLLAFEVSHGR